MGSNPSAGRPRCTLPSRPRIGPRAEPRYVRTASSTGSPKARRPGPVADERRENIARPQGQPQRHAQRLLSPAQKDAAVDFARPVEAGHLIIQDPRENHQAKRPEILLWKGSDAVLRCAPLQSLQHGM